MQSHLRQDMLHNWCDIVQLSACHAMLDSLLLGEPLVACAHEGVHITNAHPYSFCEVHRVQPNTQMLQGSELCPNPTDWTRYNATHGCMVRTSIQGGLARLCPQTLPFTQVCTYRTPLTHPFVAKTINTAPVRMRPSLLLLRCMRGAEAAAVGLIQDCSNVQFSFPACIPKPCILALNLLYYSYLGTHRRTVMIDM